MPLTTSMANLRADMKLAQERTNASYNAAKSHMGSSVRVLGVPAFALAFVFLLMSIAQPVSAGNLSDAVGPILQDVADLFTPILNLVISAVPVIIALAVISFVLGILGAILLKLKI